MLLVPILNNSCMCFGNVLGQHLNSEKYIYCIIIKLNSPPYLSVHVVLTLFY